MKLSYLGALTALLFASAFSLSAGDDLSPDQVALLQDSGGWVYLSMNDSDNGFPTQHVCFDGRPHPETCSGTLTFSPGNTFVQKTTIHHQSVSRHGTYQVTGNQLAFFDEFGTRDGPYAINIDSDNKMMTMDLPPLKTKLQLYKEYKKQQADAEHKSSNK